MRLFDLHAHVLPEIDDGARNLDISLAMLQDAAKQGVVFMAATPHYYGQRRSISEFLKARSAAVDQLTKKLCEYDFSFPTLRLGAEVYLTRGLASWEELDDLCYEGTRIILIELPYDSWGNWVYREVEQLIVNRALTVVLAHPERYLSLPWTIKKLRPFFEMKTILQINAESVLDNRRICGKLLECGCPCVLGSDAHNITDRGNQLEQAAKRLERVYGEKMLMTIQEFVESKWGL